MAVFRVRLSDGSELSIQAHSMVRDDGLIRFESPGGGPAGPLVAGQYPEDQVHEVARRYVEFDGRWIWRRVHGHTPAI